jgi:hypothetical protein
LDPRERKYRMEKLQNRELHNLFSSLSIIRVIKSRGDRQDMSTHEEFKNSCNILVRQS